MLYWCGIRVGELLALTPKDFDFEKQTLTINKSYQRLNGKDVITTPKTKKSNRIIKMPKFLCEEMQEYIGMLYEIGENERLFKITKHYLHHEMDRGSKLGGVKRIRIHDLRHTFAVHTLQRMSENGIDIYTSLPLLAKYLGHKCVIETEYYLGLTKDHFDEICSLTDNYRPSLFPEVGEDND